MKPLRIAYLLEDTGQGGGVRVVLAQADELVARGHRVRIVTKGGRPAWRGSHAEWVPVSEFHHYDASGDDFVIGTFWTTVPAALELGQTRAVHLCQGYEGAFSHYREIRGQIESVYQLPLPKIVVARSLVEVCRKFTADVTCIGQIVEGEFFRTRTPAEGHPPRLLLTGPAQADLKGVRDGYAAVEYAVAAGAELALVRVSPWPPDSGEPLVHVDEFHVGLTTAEMTRLMHSCDLFLAPNHEEEGFGLPAAEAMAAGIPVVLTAIPSYLSFDDRHDYAVFRPPHDPKALGEALLEVLGDPALRDRLRMRGREVAEQFRARRVGDRLESFFFERVSASARTRTSGR